MDDPGSASDQPVRKRARVRVTRACEECRRRKERCDGGQPCCQRCVKLDRACSYHQGRKRGLRSGYVRGVEILLGLLMHSFEGAEELIASTLQKDGEIPEPRASRGRPSSPACQSLLESWRTSAASDDLRKVLTASETEEDEELYLRNLDVKLTANFNSLPRQRREVAQSFGDLDPLPRIHHSADSVPHDASLDPATSYDHPELSRSLPSSIPPSNPPLPPHWSRLIDVYMGSTHCWLPVIEKYTLFRTATLLTDSSSAYSNRDPSPGDMASLWAALAYGSHLDPGAGQNTTPAHGGRYSDIRMVARHFAIQDRRRYENGHVHAALILCALGAVQGRWASAWLWVGRAVYIATTLGIIAFEKSSAAQLCGDSEKRLFRGCFVLDTLISSRLGVRSYLRRSDLQSTGNIAVEGLEEWETWNHASTTSTGVPVASGPSKVLSTFNDLGCLIGLLNSSNETPPGASHSAHQIQLLHEFSRTEEELSSLTPGRPVSVDDPPHPTHLRLAAAAVYTVLRSRIQATSPSSAEELPPCKSIGVLDTLGCLGSTTKDSERFGPSRLPPTVHILLRLLGNGHASSPAFQQSGNWQSRSQVPSSGDRGVPENGDPSGPAPQNPEDVPLTARGAQSLGQAFAPDWHMADMPQPMLARPPGQQPDQSQFAPENVSLDIQNDTEPVTADESGDAGLFGQLSLLDTDEWPVVSEEFMERLGFSGGDGNEVDLQTFLSS